MLGFFEEEQPQVGPKGEFAGAIESKSNGKNTAIEQFFSLVLQVLMRYKIII